MGASFKYTIQFFLISIFLLVGVFSHAQSKPSSVVKIGAILMLSGDQAVNGEEMLKGMEIAIDELNSPAEAGIRKFSLVIEDSELKSKIAHTAAKKLLSIDKVPVALNASFMESAANGSVFENAKVPVITLWDSARELEEIGDYVFGIGLWTPSSAKRASDYALKELSAKTAVVINHQAEWSEAVGELFEENFTSGGGRVLKRFSLDRETRDFRTILLKTKTLNPDVLYAPLTDNLVTFYKQIRELKFTEPIIASDIIAAEHISLSPEVFEGVYQTNAPDPETKAAKNLLAMYQTKYGEQSKLPLFVAWGYDGVMLIADAVKSVGTNSKKIKDYLYTVKDFPGASQKITFNEKGSSPVMEKMFRITNGRFELLDR